MSVDVNRYWTRFLPAFVSKRLEGRRNLQNIIGNTGWLFADKIVRLGVGLFVGVWIARYLGPAQYGIFSYAQAFVSLFAVFATLGLDGVVVRDIVRDPACRDETLGSAFLLKLVGGFLTLLLSVVSVCLLRPDDRLTWLLVTVIAAGTVFQAFDVIDFWFQSQVQSKFTVIARNSAFLLITLVKIVLILKQAPLIAFALAGLVEMVLGGVGLAAVYRMNGHRLSCWKGNVARAKGLLHECWPLILSGMVIMIYMRIDQIMIGQMLGSREVGIYSAALRISEFWYFIPMAVVNSVMPSIIEAKAISEVLYHDRLQKLFRVMACIGYAVAIPVTFFANDIIRLLYGASYSESGAVLTIHVWAGLFVALGVASMPWILSEGLTRYTFATTAIGALVNIVLNCFLIPSYGICGAAIATVIAQFIASYAANAFYYRTRVIFFKQTKAFLVAPIA
jgi:O-antigen/teichoic acid export membrane protein